MRHAPCTAFFPSTGPAFALCQLMEHLTDIDRAIACVAILVALIGLAPWAILQIDGWLTGAQRE
jgi:hypothetical protein